MERHPPSSHDSVVGVFSILDGHGVKELVNGFEVAGTILSFGAVWVARLFEALGIGGGVVAAADAGNAALACIIGVVG